jgi:hypothetical protein
MMENKKSPRVRSILCSKRIQNDWLSVCESTSMPFSFFSHSFVEYNLNQRRSSLHLAEKKELCITNYNFYAFLCWYNYVLLVSCWISFFVSVVCSFIRFFFRMLTLPYLVNIPRQSRPYSYKKGVQHKGGISYSFSGIVVVIHGTSTLTQPIKQHRI